MKPKRVEVLGVPVDCVTMEQALEAVGSMLHGDRADTIIAVNPEKVMQARRDPILLSFLMRTGLLIPDGIGVVVAARGKQGDPVERVAGSDLMPLLCELAARKGHKVFLFGAAPDANASAADRLKTRYPGLNIVGAHHGYVAEADMPALVDGINASGAEILFVALGSPRQELWMDQYVPRLQVKVCQGVGGTFDVLAGRVKRAPIPFQKLHLEWFYRLACDPRRITRQSALPKFAFRVMNRMVME